MPELIPVLTRDEIKKKVSALAATISSDYQNLDIILICVLKGAFLFFADLVRELTIPVKVDFIQAKSYGDQTATSGKVSLALSPGKRVTNTHVLVVEDIIDTGLTLNHLVEHLSALGPASIKTCVFIDKRERRQKKLVPDYIGHIVEKGFLVGYGLDHGERYRHLPEIYHLKFKPGETI